MGRPGVAQNPDDQMTIPIKKPGGHQLHHRYVAVFLLLQGAILAGYLFLPVEHLLWVLGGIAGIAAVVLLPLFPWLLIPVIVGTTALDSAGRLVQTTALGIPVTGFHLAFLVLCVSLAAHIFLTRRRSFPELPILVPLVVFLGCIAVSLTYSPNQPEATLSFVRIVCMALLLYLTQVLVDSRGKLNLAVVSMAIALAGTSTLAVLQILTAQFFLPASIVYHFGANIPRASGTYHNPNLFGTFLAVGIIFFAGIAMIPRLGRWKRALLLLPIGLGTAALVITFSRANWMALFFGIVMLLFLVGKLRYLVYVMAASVATILLIMNYVPIAAYIFDRFISIFSFFVEFGTDSRASGSARVYFVLAGLKMFLDHPLLGVGWRAFPLVFEDYQPVDFPHWLPTRESHTLFATIIAELGLVGMTAAAWIVWRIFSFGVRSTRRMQDEYLRGVMISLVAVFVTFQVSLTFTGEFANNFLWMFTGLMFAIPALDGEKRS